MTSAPRRHRLVFFLALVTCVGQSIIDTHVHLDEHGDSGCTVCAIAETGFDVEVGKVIAESSRYHPFYSFASYSLTLSPRQYELDWSRAPPIS